MDSSVQDGLGPWACPGEVPEKKEMAWAGRTGALLCTLISIGFCLPPSKKRRIREIYILL